MSTRADRRSARDRWRAARGAVGQSADALARTGDVLAANRALIAAVDAWEAARVRLAEAVTEAGWLACLLQRRRERADQRLRDRVRSAVEQRKRHAGTGRLRSADLPAHDWLKDAWR